MGLKCSLWHVSVKNAERFWDFIVRYDTVLGNRTDWNNAVEKVKQLSCNYIQEIEHDNVRVTRILELKNGEVYPLNDIDMTNI